MDRMNQTGWEMEGQPNNSSASKAYKPDAGWQSANFDKDFACKDMVLAMAYVKKQKWGELYKSYTGLERGTIFPVLDFPFMGKGACPHNE